MCVCVNANFVTWLLLRLSLGFLDCRHNNDCNNNNTDIKNDSRFKINLNNNISNGSIMEINFNRTGMVGLKIRKSTIEPTAGKNDRVISTTADFQFDVRFTDVIILLLCIIRC